MRRFKTRAGATIWGDWGYMPIPRGTLVKVAVSKAGILAVPAEVNGKRGMVAVEDLAGWPQFTQGVKAKMATAVALAPEVAPSAPYPRSAPQKGCQIERLYAGGTE